MGRNSVLPRLSSSLDLVIQAYTPIKQYPDISGDSSAFGHVNLSFIGIKMLVYVANGDHSPE